MANLWDGQNIKAMFATATRWLELNSEAINSLNVFPVPDGDTGTNMLFTMRAVMEEADKCSEQNASEVAKAMAWGALMGARGNSGVILSQILRGFSQSLEDKSAIDGATFAQAMEEASSAAYKGVSKPVEGTILTVIRESAEAAVKASHQSDDIEEILEATVKAAEESVARTPSLLPVLKEAGVVDAGGQGLLVILEGALKGLRNEPLEAPSRPVETDAISRISQAAERSEEGHVYGYCTQFLIRGEALDSASIREEIDRRSDSTVVVGDETLVRVHTHSFEPDAIVDFAKSLGEVSQVNVQNIDEQHSSLLQGGGVEDELPIATVVVAAGDGIKEVFSGLGATFVVAGGQTMNPSIRELLTAIESASAPAVIVLPNNKNIVPAARQAAALSSKLVEVVPTTSIPQGIASILAFNVESKLEDNLKTMKEALSEVRTVELTRAVRPAKVNGVKIEEGEAIGLLDGQLLASGPGPAEVVHSLAPKIKSGEYSLATVYCGAEAASSDRDGVVDSLKSCLPGVEVEVMEGGQPHYHFIISLE